MLSASVAINDGDFTKTTYNLIKEERYGEAIRILHGIPESNLTRAGLSLLAYCYYYTQDFNNAATYYEQLVQMFPNNTDYKLYYAQSLHQACMYIDAYKITEEITNSEYKLKVKKIQSAIKYGEEDFTTSREIIESFLNEDADSDINIGCILFQEGYYEEALNKFLICLQNTGFKPYISYNIALCYYKLKEYGLALKNCADIIERGIKDHPELGVGMQTEVDAAREALTDMPPRAEHELDAVTLHNQALMNFDQNPTEGFEKLQFLIQQNPFPPETFANLLLLLCQHELYDLAADVLAENAHLTYKYLTSYLYDFLDAVITRQTSPPDAYQKLDDLANRHTETLRKLTKQVQEYRNHNNTEMVKKTVFEYEECLERYIPVLMVQAKIYWELENYGQVEKIFRKSVEFCNDNDVWRLNVAHVLFMQENKFKEATGFYEPIVKKYMNDLLSVSAVVLANLCVSYIMTSQNEEAEELMRKVEKEEDQLIAEDPEVKCFHLCIINLVIGTLYCSKGNYEFGISRIIKSLEPFTKKLGTDTWYYTKRCFLSMIENLSKHMIVLKDTILQECITFLENCEMHGKNVKTIEYSPFSEEANQISGKQTVTYEARALKCILLKLQNY
ncbi:tetratricopeptide repeat protein 30A isoform X2 [Agrilus planipennis]|uniref:Tetratricopeptide repeat protein 30 n=1 Tax=Agrilus planipennis TaxID=224129 RepID=A0A7F5R2F5_AGRPL|nr:tetratricopeptide repeat protein 30A isoform X2 [Agrilus planipennis]